MDCKVHGLTKEAKLKAGEDLAIKLLDHYWQRGIFSDFLIAHQNNRIIAHLIIDRINF